MISPLEIYVKSMVNLTNRVSLPKVYLQKASALIEAKINPPCCEGNDDIDLHTQLNNFFTRTVKVLMFGVNKKSLIKAKAIIEHKLGNPCCK